MFVDLKYLCILSCGLVCHAPFIHISFSVALSTLFIPRIILLGIAIFVTLKSFRKERVSILPLFQVFIFSIRYLYVRTMETMTTIIFKLREWMLSEQMNELQSIKTREVQQ